jgi:hypothetical protein
VADVLPEEQRNRLLRRVDWRFLLPSIRVERCVCFATGTLGEALALIADRTWQPGEVPNDAACDLAVATEPDAATLRLALRRLEPGGWLYAEWRARTSAIAARARQRLSRAGFVDVRLYIPRPDPATASPAVWLPICADGAVRHHFAGAPHPSRTVLRGIAQRLRTRLWLANRHLRIASPLCALARKPHRSEAAFPPGRLSSTSMTAVVPAFAFPNVECHASRSGTVWRPASPGPLDWTLVTRGRRSINKVVALGFSGADAAPQIAVKIARVPESGNALRREAAALKALEAQKPAIRGVPRLLFCRSYDGIVALGETALIGRPFARLLHRDNALELALRATDWLGGLIAESSPIPPQDWGPRIVGPAVSAFERAYGSVLDQGMLRDALRELETLGSLPLVHEQRDFAPWNLLLSQEGQLAVLDWESAELRGLPLVDLTYFLTYVAFYIERATAPNRLREAYRATLDASTFLGALVAHCVERYAAGLTLPRSVVRPLRLLTWMLHASSEFRAFTADLAGPPPPELLRRGLFLALWEEQMRDRR